MHNEILCVPAWTARITCARRYRAALSEVYGRLPIWFEGPEQSEAGSHAVEGCA